MKQREREGEIVWKMKIRNRKSDTKKESKKD